MEAILLQAVGQTAGSLIYLLVVKGFKRLKCRCYYVKMMSKNLDNLEREEIYLSRIEKVVKSRLDKYRKQELRKAQCWLVEVEKIKDEIRQLKIEYEAVSTRKFMFLIRAMKLGKQLVKVNKKITSLKNQPHVMVEAEAEPSSVMKKYISKLYSSGGFLCACFVPTF